MSAADTTATPREGHFVLFVRYCIGFVLAYLCLIGAGLWLWVALNEHDDESNQVRIQLQITYRVLQSRYAETTPEQWPALTTALQHQFGFPLRTVALSETPALLDQESVARLWRGELVGSLDGRHAYQRLGDSDQVLTVGDLVDLDWETRPWYDEEHLDDAVLVIILVIAIALPLYFLVYRLWRDVYALGGMAMAIQHGDFSADAPAIRTRLVRPLQQALCSMATQLQDVMEGQRILSQAVAHEARTPLARMRFALAMMHVSPDDPEGVDLLDGLSADVTRLEQLASAGIAYAQFGRSAGIDAAPITVAALFDALRGLFPPASPQAPQLHFHPPHRPAFRGNHQALLLALRNLIANAQRYALEQVVVSVHLVDTVLVIAVDDDGPGVPPADRERIFQPYVQLQHHPDGFGLGLALVRIIAAKHGGTADVCESVLGGARFRLMIPQTPTSPCRD